MSQSSEDYLIELADGAIERVELGEDLDPVAEELSMDLNPNERLVFKALILQRMKS